MRITTTATTLLLLAISANQAGGYTPMPGTEGGEDGRDNSPEINLVEYDPDIEPGVPPGPGAGSRMEALSEQLQQEINNQIIAGRCPALRGCRRQGDGTCVCPDDIGGLCGTITADNRFQNLVVPTPTFPDVQIAG